MKQFILCAAVVALCFVMVAGAQAQGPTTYATATQQLNLNVNTVAKFDIPGSPTITLTISDVDIATGNMVAVSDNTTRFRMVSNSATDLTVDGAVSPALQSGYTLTANLQGGTGTSAGTVVLTGVATPVVNAVKRGAASNQMITYQFSSLTTADPLSASTYTVTYTLHN